MTLPTDDNTRALELREAFDRSFSEPTAERDLVFEDFLRLDIEGQAFAFRLEELSSVQADRVVVGAESEVCEFLGLLGLRGTLVPVYDLHTLLGKAAARAPRWLVISRGADPVGLAFDSFQGHLRRPRDAARIQLSGSGVTPHAIEVNAAPCLVIDMTSILATIESRVRVVQPAQE